MEKRERERERLNDSSIAHSIGQFIIYFYFTISERVSENKSKKKREMERTKALGFEFKRNFDHILSAIWNMRKTERKAYWICGTSDGSIRYIKFVISQRSNWKVCHLYMGKRKWPVHTRQWAWLGLNNIDKDRTINSTSHITFIRAIILHGFPSM